MCIAYRVNRSMGQKEIGNACLIEVSNNLTGTKCFDLLN